MSPIPGECRCPQATPKPCPQIFVFAAGGASLTQQRWGGGKSSPNLPAPRSAPGKLPGEFLQRVTPATVPAAVAEGVTRGKNHGGVTRSVGTQLVAPRGAPRSPGVTHSARSAQGWMRECWNAGGIGMGNEREMCRDLGQLHKREIFRDLGRREHAKHCSVHGGSTARGSPGDPPHPHSPPGPAVPAGVTW